MFIALSIVFFIVSLYSWKEGNPAEQTLSYFALGLITSYITYSRIRAYFANRKTSADIELMDPYEFEQYAAELFRKMGYSAKVTQKSDGEEGGDYGADVIVKKDGQTTVVQVKKWAPYNLVGAPDVRSVIGCMHTFKANKAILLTTSDFTEQAKTQAKGASIELWNGAHLQKLVREYT